LWHGRVDSRNSALQLLLLVDYIFDWARDLYRPGILQLLKILSKDNFDDNNSISTDSQVPSMRHKVDAWLARSDSVTDGARDAETYDFTGALADLMGYTYDPSVAFWPGYCIRKNFKCLDLRGNTLNRMIAALQIIIPEDTSTIALRLFQFFHGNLMFISSNFILSLEREWTGRRRRISDVSTESRRPALGIIFYSTGITEEWMVEGRFTCILIDLPTLEGLVDAMDDQFRQQMHDCIQSLKNIYVILPGLPISAYLPISKKGMVDLINILGWQSRIGGRPTSDFLTISNRGVADLISLVESQSLMDLLAAAMERKTAVLNTKDGLGAAFRFQPCMSESLKSLSILLQMADFIADDKVIRLSNTDFRYEIEPLIPSMFMARDPTSPIYPLLASDNIRERLKNASSDFLLVYNKDIRKKSPKAAEWCIYMLDGNFGPSNLPSTQKRIDIISKIKHSEGFYIVSHLENGEMVENVWRPFESRDPDPAHALLIAKTELEECNKIDEIKARYNLAYGRV
jgi:hypothetical protein